MNKTMIYTHNHTQKRETLALMLYSAWAPFQRDDLSFEIDNHICDHLIQIMNIRSDERTVCTRLGFYDHLLRDVKKKEFKRKWKSMCDSAFAAPFLGLEKVQPREKKSPPHNRAQTRTSNRTGFKLWVLPYDLVCVCPCAVDRGKDLGGSMILQLGCWQAARKRRGRWQRDR